MYFTLKASSFVLTVGQYLLTQTLKRLQTHRRSKCLQQSATEVAGQRCSRHPLNCTLEVKLNRETE